MEMLEYFNDDNTLSMGVAERSYIHQNNLWQCGTLGEDVRNVVMV